AESFQKDRAMGQFSLFGAEPTSAELPTVPAWPDHERLTFEREVLGTYVSSHPLVKYEKLLKNFSTPIRELIKKNPDNANVIIGGIINGLTHKVNRNGEKNLHFTLEDTTGKIHVIVPEKIVKEKQVFEENSLFMVRGKFNGWSDEPYIMLESVITLDESYEVLGKFLHIKLRELGLEESVSRDINSLLEKNKGNSTIIIHLLTEDGKEVEMVLSGEMKVKVTEQLLRQLEALVGQEHVWLSWKR
ncbi:MAG: hypothetical protein LLG37_07710, partial [Spirochaetia bacterium]|nr:hypothetical protein [Spirochaetia bacterium]